MSIQDATALTVALAGLARGLGYLAAQLRPRTSPPKQSGRRSRSRQRQRGEAPQQ